MIEGERKQEFERTEWERVRACEEMEASTSSAIVARQTWEIENNISMETPAAVDSDAIFEYDEAAQTLIQQQKPWVRDPNYFKNVKISALALLKVCIPSLFLKKVFRCTFHHRLQET